MSKFRKKPVVISAVQWQPDKKLGEFIKGKYVNHSIGTDSFGIDYLITEVGLPTLEGFMRILPGDWIITGIKGERYACRSDIFEASYEPVWERLESCPECDGDGCANCNPVQP